MRLVCVLRHVDVGLHVPSLVVVELGHLMRLRLLVVVKSAPARSLLGEGSLAGSLLARAALASVFPSAAGLLLHLSVLGVAGSGRRRGG